MNESCFTLNYLNPIIKVPTVILTAIIRFKTFIKYSKCLINYEPY